MAGYNKDDDDDDLFMDFDQYNSDDDDANGVSNMDPDDPDAVWQHIRANQRFEEPLEKDSNDTNDDTFTRLVLMSDTHGQHRRCRPPPGDVLVHGGDCSKMGEPGSLRDLRDYFEELLGSGDFAHVACIAGNHDITLHTDFYNRHWSRFRRGTVKPWDEEEIQAYFTTRHGYQRQKEEEEQEKEHEEQEHGTEQKEQEQKQPQQLGTYHYLKDNSCQIPINDDNHNDDTTTPSTPLHIYGSPWSPTFGCWAFGEERGERIRHTWLQIPDTTDVLITHGPPLGRADQTFHAGHVGCHDLLQQVQQRIRPRVHVFGHIHEGGGECTYDGTTLYCNASTVNLQYQPVHYPLVIDVPHDPSQPARVVRPQCPVATSEWVPWLQTNGFARLAPYVETVLKADDKDELPQGNEFFETDTYQDLCFALRLERDQEARKELQAALAEMYRQSFPRTKTATGKSGS